MSREHANEALHGAAMTLEARRAKTAQATEASGAKRRQAVVDSVLVDLKPLVTDDGFVTLSDAVSVALKHRRTGYARGWAAQWQRTRRAAREESIASWRPRGNQSTTN